MVYRRRCGDHAVEAVFQLPEVVDGHAVAGCDFGRAPPLDGIFVVGGDGMFFEQGAREDMLDGGLMPGETKAHIDCLLQ